MRGTRRAALLAACMVMALVPATPASAASPAAGSGYWMLGADGAVYGFGTADNCGESPILLDEGEYAVDIVPTPNGLGYWVLSNFGFVDFFDCGMPPADNAAYYHGSVVFDQLINEEAVSMSATPDGGGYWIFTTRGRVFPFGTAQYYGGLGHLTLNGPVYDSVATVSGKGYYMVASDGGIFAFGDAKFYGSTGSMHLNKPVQSMAPTPGGKGYWLVASDGGIFAFGNAPFYGSTGSMRLNQPVVGMVAEPAGKGYLLVALDGGIFAFGQAKFHGSLGSNPPTYPVLSVAVMP